MLEKRFEMVKEHHKKTFEDAAINGKMDPQLVSLCRFIASTKQFFTSSSCSGRIVLLKVNAEESKQESAFHRKWHSTVSADEVWNALEEKTKEELWLKQEPLILHIGAESIEGAKKILEIMRKFLEEDRRINHYLLGYKKTANTVFPYEKSIIC